MKNFQAYFFDMDGVVVLNDHLHQQAWFDFFRLKQLSIDEAIYSEKVCGRSARDVLKVFFPDAGKNQICALADEREALYRIIAQGQLAMVEGVESVLSTIKAHSIPISLVTSAPRINVAFVFDQFKIESYFDAIITGEDVLQGKPHPEPYLTAASKIGASNRCLKLAVEDSPSGILSAKAAGCMTLGITTSNCAEALSEADAIIDGFDLFEKTITAL